ncbi:MAG: hypothetical protein MUF48_05585 [Pirellulaceae bacterium]|nr:hypothetical protein [Pirellulaceae bacterium]
MNRTWPVMIWSLCGVLLCPPTAVQAQRVVPGTGTLIDYVGDDFEDPDWSFVRQGLKSSDENDKQSRYPLGYSGNRRWFEGPERGYPDQLKVIAAPAGGVAGSQYALQIATLHSGVPGYNSRDVQQDDLIVDCISRLGGSIPVSELPNCVVRVYLPPQERWEQRSGPHFGFRLGVTTTTRTPSTGLFARGSEATSEPYWPGMWIHFRKASDRKGEQLDAAFIKVRGDQRGRDFHVLNIPEAQFGWWTLGMSITADGMVHYYASPGVDPLTAADYLTSQYPYSFRAERFRTFFFNICNRNDGQTWSTPFVIDDPQLFLVHASRVASIVQRKQQSQQRHANAKSRVTDSRHQ